MAAGGDKDHATTYDPSMNRSNPSAAESASEVSAALVPRAADVAADIYRLIVQEIQALRGDKRMQALLEASVAENVSTMLHILQHGIDLENVRAPAARSSPPTRRRRRSGSGTRAPPGPRASAPCYGTSSPTWPPRRPSWATGCASTIWAR
jgi:hypothetical protein